MEEILDQLEATMDIILKRDSMFKKVAQAYSKTLEALLDEGFSREEAITIIAGQGLSVKAS